MADTLMVFYPAAPCQPASQVRHALDDLRGKVVGFIDNTKPNFHYLVDDIGRMLIERYGVARIVARRKQYATVPATDAVIRELSGQCDVVIAGSGD